MKAKSFYQKVRKHLLTQKKKATNLVGSCVYLDANGLKCAVGCLIPGGHPGFENGGVVSDLFGEFPDLEKRFLRGWDRNADELDGFLSDLQEIHDGSEVRDWEEDLNEFAEKEHLL